MEEPQYTSYTKSVDSPSPKKGRGGHSFLIILLIIIIIVAGGAYFYVNYSYQSTGEEDETTQDVESETYLKLITDKELYKIGEEFFLNVQIETNMETSGVDVVLIYDPLYLELVEREGEGAAKYLQLSPDLAYENYPFAETKEFDEMMVFAFSAITDAEETFKGKETVAGIKFKTLKLGDTSIDIVSDESLSLDSNVAFGGEDVLTEASGVSITIGD